MYIVSDLFFFLGSVKEILLSLQILIEALRDYYKIYLVGNGLISLT